jgi:hypothetical protein
MPFIPILFIGRLLGGFSTSILFSSFESWLISSSNAAGLPSSDLSNIMGRATLINGIVATTAGVVSNQLVGITRNLVSPFFASGALLVLAWCVIRRQWSENYGSQSAIDRDVFQVRRLGQAWNIVRKGALSVAYPGTQSHFKTSLKDPLLLTLGLTQTCFEGSMYLFVFLWVPSLQEHAAQHTLPLGYIFSSFMICMMLGSLFYTAIVSQHQPSSATKSNTAVDSSLTDHAKMSSLVCGIGALALASSVAWADERYRFWAFCLFEACVGLYYPVQGTLRGALISDEHRATVNVSIFCPIQNAYLFLQLSSLFRVPLNIFVVASLLIGVSERTKVLTASSLMLTLSSIMTGVVIVARSDDRALLSPANGRGDRR